jgi:hypothetical protein
MTEPAHFEKLREILSRMGVTSPNPYRIQNMLDKMRVARETEAGPRRIENVGGYFKFPPDEVPPRMEAPPVEDLVTKTAQALRPLYTIVPRNHQLLRMRSAWLRATPAGQR